MRQILLLAAAAGVACTTPEESEYFGGTAGAAGVASGGSAAQASGGGAGGGGGGAPSGGSGGASGVSGGGTSSGGSCNPANPPDGTAGFVPCDGNCSPAWSKGKPSQCVPAGNGLFGAACSSDAACTAGLGCLTNWDNKCHGWCRTAQDCAGKTFCANKWAQWYADSIPIFACLDSVGFVCFTAGDCPGCCKTNFASGLADYTKWVCSTCATECAAVCSGSPMTTTCGACIDKNRPLLCSQKCFDYLHCEMLCNEK